MIIKGAKPQQQDIFSKEIEKFMIDNCNKEWIEDTLLFVKPIVALHSLFDFSTDRLILDNKYTGYTHKYLTYRKDLINKTKNSISPILSSEESMMDVDSPAAAGMGAIIGLHLLKQKEIEKKYVNVIVVVDYEKVSLSEFISNLDTINKSGKKIIIILRTRDKLSTESLWVTRKLFKNIHFDEIGKFGSKAFNSALINAKYATTSTIIIYHDHINNQQTYSHVALPLVKNMIKTNQNVWNLSNSFDFYLPKNIKRRIIYSAPSQIFYQDKNQKKYFVVKDSDVLKNGLPRNVDEQSTIFVLADGDSVNGKLNYYNLEIPSNLLTIEPSSIIEMEKLIEFEPKITGTKCYIISSNLSNEKNKHEILPLQWSWIKKNNNSKLIITHGQWIKHVHGWTVDVLNAQSLNYVSGDILKQLQYYQEVIILESFANSPIWHTLTSECVKNNIIVNIKKVDISDFNYYQNFETNFEKMALTLKQVEKRLENGKN